MYFTKLKYFSLGAILGFLIFFLYSENFQQDIYLLAARKPIIDLAPFKELNFTDIAINKSSDLILNDTKKVTQKLPTRKKCNIFDGKWVYKPEESISYNSFNCPFISEKMSCQVNGRPDSKYENWRWEARDCDIPL
ncbi:Protein trichome birefringence-like 43 [Bienertia sinuspersici]